MTVYLGGSRRAGGRGERLTLNESAWNGLLAMLRLIFSRPPTVPHFGVILHVRHDALGEHGRELLAERVGRVAEAAGLMALVLLLACACASRTLAFHLARLRGL